MCNMRHLTWLYSSLRNWLQSLKTKVRTTLIKSEGLKAHPAQFWRLFWISSTFHPRSKRNHELIWALCQFYNLVIIKCNQPTLIGKQFSFKLNVLIHMHHSNISPEERWDFYNALNFIIQLIKFQSMASPMIQK